MKANPIKSVIGWLKQGFYFKALMVHLLIGLGITVFVYGCLKRTQQLAVERWFAKRLLRLFNIQLKIVGDTYPTWQTDQTAYLFVSNHISWIDVFALNAVGPVRFIAKAEISQWPLLGRLARRTGTLFIERGRRHAVRRVVHEAAHRLNQGQPIAVFPEGTTTTGEHVLPFHSNFIHAAVLAQAPVVPVTIQYVNSNNEHTTTPAYVDNQSLVENVLMLIQNRGQFTVVLTFHEPINAQLDRHDIAQQALHTIRQSLRKTPNPIDSCGTLRKNLP